jgi:hypothetical protein
MRLLRGWKLFQPWNDQKSCGQRSEISALGVLFNFDNRRQTQRGLRRANQKY